MSETLDQLLAEGSISRMGYLLARMKQVEAEADAIIAATPKAQPARLALAYDQRADMQPRPRRRYHD